MESFEEAVSKYLEKLESHRDSWNEFIKDTSRKLKDIRNVVDIQVDLYSRRQILLEDRFTMQTEVARQTSKIKRLKAERFIYYEEQYQLRTKGTDRAILMDSDLRDDLQLFDIAKNQLDFLNETMRTIDSLIFAIKHRISLEELGA